MNFDKNGFILSHDQLMSNQVVEMKRGDIEALITNFCSEEQRWSQAVREEVKYKDTNPGPGNRLGRCNVYLSYNPSII